MITESVGSKQATFDQELEGLFLSAAQKAAHIKRDNKAAKKYLEMAATIIEYLDAIEMNDCVRIIAKTVKETNLLLYSEVLEKRSEEMEQEENDLMENLGAKCAKVLYNNLITATHWDNNNKPQIPLIFGALFLIQIFDKIFLKPLGDQKEINNKKTKAIETASKIRLKSLSQDLEKLVTDLKFVKFLENITRVVALEEGLAISLKSRKTSEESESSYLNRRPPKGGLRGAMEEDMVRHHLKVMNKFPTEIVGKSNTMARKRTYEEMRKNMATAMMRVEISTMQQSLLTLLKANTFKYIDGDFLKKIEEIKETIGRIDTCLMRNQENMTQETAPLIMIKVGKEMMEIREMINLALASPIIKEVDSLNTSIFGNKEEIARLENKINDLEKRIMTIESNKMDLEMVTRWKDWIPVWEKVLQSNINREKELEKAIQEIKDSADKSQVDQYMSENINRVQGKSLLQMIDSRIEAWNNGSKWHEVFYTHFQNKFTKINDKLEENLEEIEESITEIRRAEEYSAENITRKVTQEVKDLQKYLDDLLGQNRREMKFSFKPILKNYIRKLNSDSGPKEGSDSERSLEKINVERTTEKENREKNGNGAEMEESTTMDDGISDRDAKRYKDRLMQLAALDGSTGQKIYKQKTRKK